MPTERKGRDKNPSRRKDDYSRKLQRPDGEKKLSNCTLREAVESVYATFASCFRGFGYPPSKKFFEEDIPGMVFDVAVGAGWIPLATEALLEEKSPDLQGRRLVQFGDFMIEPWYREAFIALLEDEIIYHSHDPTNTKARLDSLPKFTTKAEREELLQEYLSKHSSEKIRITDIPVLASVDYRDFKRWRKGPPTEADPRGLSDTSVKAMRIAILLRYDDRTQNKKHKANWWGLSPS